MKFHESLFEEYLQKAHQHSLHPKLDAIYTLLPENINSIQNMILYGPRGTGKYTQLLKILERYSPSNLKYEKKMSVSCSKSRNPIIIKISDIHFEVDMSLLGCNSKIIWNELFNNITDVVLSRPDKIGIIVCKNFHDIHSELLDIFYSYMQCNNKVINLKFAILTEQISFIPTNIVQRCSVISIPRASRAEHIRCFGADKISRNLSINNIDNLKKLNNASASYKPLYINICERLLSCIESPKNTTYSLIRENLYNLLVYNVDLQGALWYIVHQLISRNKLPHELVPNMLTQLWNILHLYNNNYRPIYHLERFIFYLITAIHEHKKSSKDFESTNIILKTGSA